MPAQYLQLLERALEPVVAEFMRLVLLFMVATSIALVVLATVMLGVYLIAAWREARAGRAARRVLGVAGNTSRDQLRTRRMKDTECGTDGTSSTVHLIMTTIWHREPDGWRMVHLHKSAGSSRTCRRMRS